MKNPKNKGNNFERKISKKLSLWWSSGEREDIFYRTHSSGARFTNRYMKDKTIIENQTGDIMSSAEDGFLFISFFTVECKHYKFLNFWSLIDKPTKDNLYFWWIKLKEQCELNNTNPFLIVKQNNRPELLFVNEFTYKHILKKLKLNNIMYFNTFEDSIHVYKFEDILKVESSKLKNILEMNKNE